MMTPWEIRWFSRLFLTSLASSAIVTVATWNDIVAPLSKDLATPGMLTSVAGAMVVSFAISLLLWWLIVQRRSVVAKWILSFLILIGLERRA